jgi:hypothetical protein
MTIELIAVAERVNTDAKYDEAKRLLLAALQKLADRSKLLNPNRPPWKPLLDSRRVVRVVLGLETLFPSKFPPDKLVKKGGYNDVEKAADDILRRHKQLTSDRAKNKRGRK